MKHKKTALRTAAALSVLTAGAVATVALTTGAGRVPLAQADTVVKPTASTGTSAADGPTATASPLTAGSPGATASARPTPTPLGAGGNPAGFSGTASNSASNTAPAPPAPLPAAQLPDSRAAKWKPIAPPHTQPVHHQIQLNECADVNGATIWQQQGYVSSFGTPAIQDSFTFHDAAAAQASYHAVLAEMGDCQATSASLQTASRITPDAQVARTATTADGSAYSRRWTGVAPISAPGPQTDHIYVVQRGNVLTVLQYAVPSTTTGATPQTSADDEQQLATMDAELTAVSGH